MSFSRRLLPLAYPPLAALHAVRGQPRLRVLLCHDIPPEHVGDFAHMLEWLARRWAFVSPACFAELVSGDAPIERDSLLLTFDDGFESNRVVAERVLAPLGITAIFFIVAGFATLEDRADQVRFIRENLGLVGLKDVPDHLRNMSLVAVRRLLAAGHVIGAHTLSHARLSSTNDAARLTEEIVVAADRLERETGARIEHFAFPFGNLASFSPAALDIARRRFRFVHTGMRGDNAARPPAWAIRRDAIGADDGRMLVGAFLEGAADRLYAEDLATYESWGR